MQDLNQVNALRARFEQQYQQEKIRIMPESTRLLEEERSVADDGELLAVRRQFVKIIRDLGSAVINLDVFNANYQLALTERRDELRENYIKLINERKEFYDSLSGQILDTTVTANYEMCLQHFVARLDSQVDTFRRFIFSADADYAALEGNIAALLTDRINRVAELQVQEVNLVTPLRDIESRMSAELRRYATPILSNLSEECQIDRYIASGDLEGLRLLLLQKKVTAVEQQGQTEREFLQEIFCKLWSDGNSLLHKACFHGKKIIVDFLLDIDARAHFGLLLLKNVDGYYPIHSALKHTEDTIVVLDVLKKYWLSPNNKKQYDAKKIRELFLECKGDCGRQPLHTAATFGNMFGVIWLCNPEQHVDINALTDVRGFLSTPLHNAAEKGHVEILDYLLLKGANFNLMNSAGERPIVSAVCLGQADAALVFLRHGICLSKQDLELISKLHQTKTKKADVAKSLITLQTKDQERIGQAIGVNLHELQLQQEQAAVAAAAPRRWSVAMQIPHVSFAQLPVPQLLRGEPAPQFVAAQPMPAATVVPAEELAPQPVSAANLAPTAVLDRDKGATSPPSSVNLADHPAAMFTQFIPPAASETGKASAQKDPNEGCYSTAPASDSSAPAKGQV